MSAGFGAPTTFWGTIGAGLGGAGLGATVLLVPVSLIMLKESFDKARESHGRIMPDGNNSYAHGAYESWSRFGVAFFVMQSFALGTNFAISWGWLTQWESVFLALLIAFVAFCAQLIYFGAFSDSPADMHYPVFAYASVIGFLTPLSFLLAILKHSSLDPKIWTCVCVLNAAAAAPLLASLTLVADRFLFVSLQCSCVVGLAALQLALRRMFPDNPVVLWALANAAAVCLTPLLLFLLFRRFSKALLTEDRIFDTWKDKPTRRVQLGGALFFLLLCGLLVSSLWYETTGFADLRLTYDLRTALILFSALLLLATSIEALGNLILACITTVHLRRAGSVLRKLSALIGARPSDLETDLQGNIVGGKPAFVERIIREGNLEAGLRLSAHTAEFNPRLNMFIVNTLLQRGDHSTAAVRQYAVHIEKLFMSCVVTQDSEKTAKSLVASLFLGNESCPQIHLDREKLHAYFAGLAAHGDLFVPAYESLLADFLRHGSIIGGGRWPLTCEFTRTLSVVKSRSLPATPEEYQQRCLSAGDWESLREAYLLGPYNLEACLALLKHVPEDRNADLYRHDLFSNSLKPCFTFPVAGDEAALVGALFRGEVPDKPVGVNQDKLVSFLKSLGALGAGRDAPLRPVLANILSVADFSVIQGLCSSPHNTLASAVALTRILRRVPGHAAMVEKLFLDPLVMLADSSTTEEGCPASALVFDAFCLCNREEKETPGNEQPNGHAAT